MDKSDYGGVVRMQGHIKSARWPAMSHAPRHSAPGSKCAAILTWLCVRHVHGRALYRSGDVNETLHRGDAQDGGAINAAAPSPPALQHAELAAARPNSPHAKSEMAVRVASTSPSSTCHLQPMSRFIAMPENEKQEPKSLMSDGTSSSLGDTSSAWAGKIVIPRPLRRPHPPRAR